MFTAEGFCGNRLLWVASESWTTQEEGGLSLLPEPARPSIDADAQHRAVLRRYFLKRVPAHEVDDLVQDVLAGLHARRSDAPIENLGGYLFTAAAHALSRKRQLDARFRGIDGQLADASWVDPITPERILTGRARLDAAMVVLRGLPDRTRHVFLLHRFEDMTYRAIASQFGISVSAVEKHMMNALRALGDAMEREA